MQKGTLKKVKLILQWDKQAKVEPFL